MDIYLFLYTDRILGLALKCPAVCELKYKKLSSNAKILPSVSKNLTSKIHLLGPLSRVAFWPLKDNQNLSKFFDVLNLSAVCQRQKPADKWQNSFSSKRNSFFDQSTICFWKSPVQDSLVRDLASRGPLRAGCPFDPAGPLQIDCGRPADIISGSRWM